MDEDYCHHNCKKSAENFLREKFYVETTLSVIVLLVFLFQSS